MAESSYGALNSVSMASSCFPSTKLSTCTYKSSETGHSTFARKSHGDTGVVQVSADNSVANHITAGEHPSSDIFSLSDQQLSEKLRFVKEVGFGNWGSVWLCEPRLAEERALYGSQVAVKLVHRSKTPTTAARVRSLWNEMKIVRALRREASASGSAKDISVGHPSVVQFHSFIITPSYALITMQYLPTPIPVEVPEYRAKTWFLALTSGVNFLHQRGVVHNDIKPANIILTGASPPMPVLVDFGFAEHYTLTSRHAFQSNLAYGTPEYLAPERARGQPHDTRKSDVYALGVTFFEILVGRTPFEEVEGESFVSKEDLERYWARTVKGKWIGKWEGIMSKPCEKALKRMTLPNADLRATASDVLNDPYFRGDVDEFNRSNMSFDLSVLSEIVPPWSRPTLAQSKLSKSKGQSNLKNSRLSAKRLSRPSTSARARQSPAKSAAKAARAADKENVEPIKSETVKSRGTLHLTSKSITEAFRKSVGTSKKAPKKTAVEVFEIVAQGDIPAESTPVLKQKTSSAVLKRKISAVVLREKNSISILREKNLATKDSSNALKERNLVAPVLKEQRSTTFALSAKKEKEPTQDKENAKPKGHGKTLSITLSFSRSFGRKKAKENVENDELLLEKRPSLYFAGSPETPTTPTDPRLGAIPRPENAAPKESIKSPTLSSRPLSPVPPPAKVPLHARDVRSVFGLMTESTTPPVPSSQANAGVSPRDTNASAPKRFIAFAIDPKQPSTPTTSSQPLTNSVRGRQALYDRTHKLETPERIQPASRKANVTSKPLASRSAIAPSPLSVSKLNASPAKSARGTATPNKPRVSKITAKENRRTSVTVRSSPAKTRGTPVKTKPSPGRVRASPAKVAASPAKTRNAKVPVFSIGPKTDNPAGSKVSVKKGASKVLCDATNVTGSVRSRKPSRGPKKSQAKAEDAPDEGDDTITLPVEIIRNATLPRTSKGSSTSIIKQSLRQSIDKAMRFGRSSVSATESNRCSTSECPQPKRSLSVGEKWDDAMGRTSGPQGEQSATDDQDARMAIWIRGVEKVVEDARQSFQTGDSTPLPLPPPPPRLNNGQSAGLTRISTSAKDPTLRTMTSDANPNVTTFAAAPQAPARSRRATVGSTTPPSTAASFVINNPPIPQGRISRPITPCLNAELGKEPAPITSPRLSDVLDSDSRKLILAPVGMSESSHSASHENTPTMTTSSIDTQSTHPVRTPSPSNGSRSRISFATLLRPDTAMSEITDSNLQTTETAYEQFLMTQSTVIRNGKGYQSDFNLRGRGIEHIAPNSGAQSKARYIIPGNPSTDPSSKVLRAFKTMVTGGSKRRAPIPSSSSVFVGGGFGTNSQPSWTKTVTSVPRSWSRAQAM